MDYAIVYWSRFGHNKKIAEELSKKLKEKGGKTKIFTTNQVDPTNMPNADTYIFSAPAEAFRVQKNMRRLIKNLDDMNRKKYAIINTHSLRKNWLKSMDRILSKKDMTKLAELDFKINKEGQKEGKGFIKNWEKELEEFTKKL